MPGADRDGFNGRPRPPRGRGGGGPGGGLPFVGGSDQRARVVISSVRFA